MAMESKGFCGDAPRSYYTVPRVRAYDLAASAARSGGLVLGMLFLALLSRAADGKGTCAGYA